MNRKKYLILTTMLSLLCINKTYAACTQQEINDFKKIEDEYKITYKFDKETKTYVAIKRFTNEDSNGIGIHATTLREISMLSQLNHKNILKILLNLKKKLLSLLKKSWSHKLKLNLMVILISLLLMLKY